MRALISGITGQDGSYLAELLLWEGYEVHGLVRRSSSFNTSRIDAFFDRLHLHQADTTDALRISQLVHDIQPHEIYHLACQSHVKSSFDQPLFTQGTVVDGTLNLLEAIRIFSPHSKFYYAGSSEQFGNSYPDFKPVSPYGCAKLYSYHLCELYREAYKLFIVSGILFNHESPRRGLTFVSRKIARGVAMIAAGKQEKLVLGNLEAKRDWGYAPEFCEAIYLLMQQPVPRNCEIGTGETHSIREFVDEALKLCNLPWTVIETDAKYTRPFEVDVLKADPAKYAWLGWQPQVKFKELVKIMVEAELAQLDS